MNTGELKAFFEANAESRRAALAAAAQRIEARIAEMADPCGEAEEQYVAGLYDAIGLLWAE